MTINLFPDILFCFPYDRSLSYTIAIAIPLSARFYLSTRYIVVLFSLFHFLDPLTLCIFRKGEGGGVRSLDMYHLMSWAMVDLPLRVVARHVLACRFSSEREKCIILLGSFFDALIPFFSLCWNFIPTCIAPLDGVFFVG